MVTCHTDHKKKTVLSNSLKCSSHPPADLKKLKMAGVQKRQNDISHSYVTVSAADISHSYVTVSAAVMVAVQAKWNCFIILSPISVEILELWISENIEKSVLKFSGAAGAQANQLEGWEVLYNIQIAIYIYIYIYIYHYLTKSLYYLASVLILYRYVM